MARKYHQGKFIPKYPHKYRGKVNDIYYRSSWELKVMQFLDECEDVIAWASEEVVIRYISPVDNRPHRYFVDFVFQKRDKYGETKVHLVEIKPFAQTLPPQKKKKTQERFLQEVMTYGVNQAKWQAAKKICQEKNWQFHVITEKNLKSLGVK